MQGISDPLQNLPEIKNFSQIVNEIIELNKGDKDGI